MINLKNNSTTIPLKTLRTEDPKIDIPENPLCTKAIKSLAKRIQGYVLKEVKTTYEFDAEGNKRIKNEVVTRKQVVPDLSAITFTLTNLDPQRWKTKPSSLTESDPDVEEKTDLSQLSESALREISGLMEN